MSLMRKDFMSGSHKQAMGNLPRTHENCLEKTGVCRPGKTAHDHATGSWAPAHVRRQRNIDNQPGAKK